MAPAQAGAFSNPLSIAMERRASAICVSIALVIIAVAVLIWDDSRRDREFDLTAPIVKTCISHNVRQKVVIQR